MKKLLLFSLLASSAFAENVYVTNDANHPAQVVCVSGCSSGGGTPGGSSGDIQTNNGSGGFGAITPAAGIATFLATPSSANLATAVTNETGSGALTFATSPTLVTPTLGVATATSINGNTITTGTGTLTLGAGKTTTFDHTSTFTTTDAQTYTFPTTSATLARTDAANTFTGTQTVGALVATTVNGNTITTGTGTLTLGAGKTTTFDHTSTFTTTDSQTYTFPTTSATLARTDAANTFTGASATTNWTANTQSASDNSTKLATTAYADNQATVGVGPNHAVYAAASPPTTDVGIFTITKASIDMKNAATTSVFTVPTSRAFVAIQAQFLVTSVTSGGAGTETFTLKESGGSNSMVQGTASGSATPVAGMVYNEQATAATGAPFTQCAAGNIVQVVVSASQAGSTAVTGTLFVTGFYSQ